MRIYRSVSFLFFFLFFSLSLYAGKPDEFYKNAKKSLKSSKKEALKYYSEALKYSDASWKKRAKCLNDRAVLLFEMKLFPQALKDLGEALELDSKMLNAWKYSVKILYEMGRFSEALNQSEQALEITQRDEEIYYLRGVIFFKLFLVTNDTIRTNMLNSSSEALTNAIDLNRKYSEAYYYRGLVNMATNDLDLAQKDLGKAIKYNKKYSAAYLELARIHLKKKENIRAIDYLKTSLTETPDYYEGLEMMLALCAQSDFREEIQTYLSQALKYYPSDRRFRNMNRYYKAVAEDTLPVMKEKKEPPVKKIKKSTPRKPSVMLLTQERNQGEMKRSEGEAAGDKVKLEFVKKSESSANEPVKNSAASNGGESNWY